MARRLASARLVIASHNPGKVHEIAAFLEPYRIEAVPIAGLDLPEPEETGQSFVENAELKARAAAKAANIPSLADDSGLTVAALNGAPGVYSARWAGPNKDFRFAMARVDRELAGKSDRRAAFICALSLAWPDGHCETVEGRVDGIIVWPPRGTQGFGYDPIFLPDGFATTFGEMDQDAKDRISHRGDAFRKLAARCFSS
jgi:XTP/dITP diphosphohydrolase